jgi:hypothetical protein
VRLLIADFSEKAVIRHVQQWIGEAFVAFERQSDNANF